MLGQDYAEAEDRLRNALHHLGRLVTYSVERYPASSHDPRQREDLRTLHKVRHKVRRIREELDRTEPEVRVLRTLADQIMHTRNWTDM